MRLASRAREEQRSAAEVHERERRQRLKEERSREGQQRQLAELEKASASVRATVGLGGTKKGLPPDGGMGAAAAATDDDGTEGEFVLHKQKRRRGEEEGSALGEAPRPGTAKGEESAFLTWPGLAWLGLA